MDRPLSHSSMKCWRRCRYQYHLKYMLDYDTFPSAGQIRGSMGHKGLETWYINFPDKSDEDSISAARDKAFKAMSDSLFQYEELMSRDFANDWDTMEQVLDRYMQWSVEHDSFDEIITTEEKFSITIGNTEVIGYIDGIVKIKGVNWLLEHKFLKRVSTKHLELDPQVNLYLLAARKNGYNPRGVFYNIVRTTIGGIAESEPVVRLPVYRNEEGLKAIESEIESQIAEMVDYHEKGGHLYRNATDTCGWDCGFYDVCCAINDDGNPEPVLKKYPTRKESENFSEIYHRLAGDEDNEG